MIIRRIGAISLISLFCFVSIKAQTNQPDPNKLPDQKCESGMFSCAKDASCIPMDWVGDNELDCSDGSDEHNSEGALPPSSKSNKSKQKIKDASASKPVPSIEEQHDSTTCTAENEQKLNECAKDLEAWTNELRQTNFSNFSLLSDDSSISKIDHGCSLFHEFTACTDGLPNSCQIQDANVRDFHSLQMFTCELLVPSVKEHWNCFSAIGKQNCTKRQIFRAANPKFRSHEEKFFVRKSTRNSIFCSIIDSVNAEIECINKQHPSECDEAALEMFEPMKMETSHSFEDLNCIEVTPSASIDQEPIEHEVEVEKPKERQEVKPTLEHPSINKPLSTATNIDLSNSLYTFGNTDAVCADEDKSDIWSIIRKRICARKSDLLPHSACFLETATKEKKCASRLLTQTPCAAIDTFNKNVDCIINALNELCPIEAQDIVIAIQEGLNDDAIGLKCYEERDAAKIKESGQQIGDADFRLTPKNPRCSADQENQALVCLVELIEINNSLAKFRTTDFLIEISDNTSKLINPVCDLYNKYEKCLNNSVFNSTNGQRCAFSSPLNTLARIGLSPICSPESRQILFGNKECLKKVSKIPAAAQCQSGLQFLGRTVELMINGIHSEALLCNTFYMLRNTFDCGQVFVKDNCDEKSLTDLLSLKDKITELGIVEGCPKDKPANLDEIIARPVNKTLPGRISHAPKARPMTTVPLAPACEPDEQKRFGECIQPLTAFQPHPLAVIKQPKEIDNACKAYKEFNTCRSSIKCNPLWAKGMSAMFEFACGAGYERFNQVRQCIRKTTTREDIRECVNVFSKGAPQKACESSSRLLSCSVPAIKERCGEQAVDFVNEYVKHFASTIDPQCKLGEESVGIKAINTLNCSANEDQIVQHCSAPINDLGSRLEDLFQGGLQSFLRNLNNLAPVFAQGCNLTHEFRECARPILEANNSCVVSSCLIKSGNGICNQPDIALAIDTQLGCIFKQVSDPEFGKCLRSTIATLKVFHLAAIREMLPKFTTCVEPLVIQKCGPAPLDVLRALGSNDTCPISYKPENVQRDIIPTETTPVCTESMREEFRNCSQEFYKKYSFEPLTILNKAEDIQTICQEIDSHQECFDRYPVCEQQSSGVGLRSLVRQVCSSQEIFKQHYKCLASVKESKGKACLNQIDMAPQSACKSMTKVVDCVAKEVQQECGDDSLKFMVDITNDYLHNLSPSDDCMLTVPTIALETGCSEQQLVQYLECEALVDRYSFRPVTFISNASAWESFCEMVSSKYRPCLDKLECRFEPVSTASITLFENLCEREITRRDQRKYAECLGEVADSEMGQACLKPYKNIDLLTKDAPQVICTTINNALSCIGSQINKKCGNDAFLHVYDIHGTWMRVFNSTCVLQPNEESNSVDSNVQIETTTPSLTTTTSIRPTDTSTTQETTKSTLPASSKASHSFLHHILFVLSAILMLF